MRYSALDAMPQHKVMRCTLREARSCASIQILWHNNAAYTHTKHQHSEFHLCCYYSRNGARNSRRVRRVEMKLLLNIRLSHFVFRIGVHCNICHRCPVHFGLVFTAEAHGIHTTACTTLALCLGCSTEYPACVTVSLLTKWSEGRP